MIVEVAYATPDEQVVIEVDVPDFCTVSEAINRSGILERFPEIDLASTKLGVFSQSAQLDTPLHPKDRVEIYRPLTIDPKEARVLRASKKAK